jgi:lipopolysaccharide/colanic/teichoic acid biosynthesis glycosyltransferase
MPPELEQKPGIIDPSRPSAERSAAQRPVQPGLSPVQAEASFAQIGLSLIRAERSVMQPASAERARRVLNLVVASLAIVVAGPLMLLIAILIKLDSKGPVIFTQPRVGLDRRSRRQEPRPVSRRSEDRGGRIFTIYKFRTMTCTPHGDAERWADENDPRVTRVGRFLRATRLDELPQLFNVVKGDMNIVGPRPEQPSIFAELREEVNAYHERQRVLPGITGWAQVNLGYDSSIDDVRRKVALDLEYIDGRSPRTDLVIMAKTMPVMVLGKGSR